MSDKRYIESSFPIVALNPLSRRERNAFKPIYKMHKWFARRSPSIFRAILLGAALPETGADGEPIDLMHEFYQGHADDPRLRHPDGRPLRVLDPFMGGGTTVVEALRLGFEVVGVDYNPIAWFIVKGETEPVDLDALRAAYDRVAAKVKEPLLEMYRTPCPLTGEPADIIYGFWVKQGICQSPTCDGITDLFKSYEVARKRGDASLAYWTAKCPHCKGTFDWELNRCTVTAGGPQVLGIGAAGKKRPAHTAFAFGRPEDGVECPHCEASLGLGQLGKPGKAKAKKVALHVIVDPTTGDFFEVRGKLPPTVTAPVSGHTFDPSDGPAQRGGKFVCGTCGLKQAIVEAADAHGEPLPFRYYGFYAHTPHTRRDEVGAARMGLGTNNDKWFAPVAAGDLARVEAAEAELARVRDELPLPDQAINDGYNTNRLVIHQYRQWWDLFGPRQLLNLGYLLRAIAEEGKPSLRDALLGAFQRHLDNTSNIASYNMLRNLVRHVTAAHDFRNPTGIVEMTNWGTGHGQNTFERTVDNYINGLKSRSGDAADGDVSVEHWKVKLFQASAAEVPLTEKSVDVVVTDPPYAGSVQYAEMADYFYVWLHQVLADHYEAFEPSVTLKSAEIVENGDLKDVDWFFDHLTDAWRECHRVLVDDGLLVFTFHHKEGDRWTGLLRSLFDAGFYLVAAYPTHSEALNSIVIQATGGITYDIIHVCRKRPDELDPIPWSVLRRDVLRAGREQLARIEAGGDVLPGPDVWMILLGSALQLFSRHYGQVLDYDGTPLDLDEAMARLRVLVREVRGESLPLPGALEDVDGLSKVYLLHVVGNESWTRDGLHIELRGYAHSTDHLLDAGLVEVDPDDRGWLRVVPPLQRAAERAEAWASGRVEALVDRMHHLLGVAEGGGRIEDAARRFRGSQAALIEGLRYLAKADAELREAAGLVIRALEALADEPPTPSGVKAQMGLFD